MHLFAISPEKPFMEQLVAGLTARIGRQPDALGETTIFLPTRRACRLLQDTLLSCFEQRLSSSSLLMPHIVPLGDMDHAELTLSSELLQQGQRDIPMKPLAPLHEKILVARLLKAKSPHMAFEQTLSIASTLLSFVQELQSEDIDPASIQTLLENEFAEHWKESITFLTLFLECWPAILKERVASDRMDYRHFWMRFYADSLPRHPHHVIAAGVRGGTPVVNELLRAIARHPKGAVILPALDSGMEESCWDALSHSHPLFLTKQLLNECGVDRKEVPEWGDKEGQSSLIWREVFRPSETSHRWHELPAEIARAHEHIDVLACRDQHEEALIIAMMMREALEVPGKTASLITAEQRLREQVREHLKRWDLVIDDSAGRSLSDAPTIQLMRLIAKASLDIGDGVALLACLKHPFATMGFAPEHMKAMLRRFERHILRKERDHKVLDDYIAHAHDVGDPDLLDWCERLAEILRPFLSLCAKEELGFAEFLSCHIDLAEKLAATEEEEGAARLWRYDSGQAASEHFSQLLDIGRDIGMIAAEEYAPLFDRLCAAVSYYPTEETHPRLKILSPIEARLHHADHIILGGLQEGVWPSASVSNPWLSRSMRDLVGLLPLEKEMGDSAHDMYCLAHAKQLTMSYAKKQGDSPTAPSRWLARFQNITTLWSSHKTPSHWHSWAHALGTPKEKISISLPAPKPPLSVRPRRLSVTRIEQGMSNPYQLYARDMLRLYPLAALSGTISLRHFGNLVHHFLEQAEFAGPTQGEASLQEAIAAYTHHPAISHIWRRHLHAVLGWFEDYRAASQPANTYVEKEGDLHKSVQCADETIEVTICGKADRLEFTADGLHIVDYKTGALPSARKIKRGESLQLPLLALIAKEGGFADVTKGSPIAKISYIDVSGLESTGRGEAVSGDMDDLLRQTALTLDQFLHMLYSSDTEFRPTITLKETHYNPYVHLSRMRECVD